MKVYDITNEKRGMIWDALKGPIDRLIGNGVNEEEIEAFVRFSFEWNAAWFEVEEELRKRYRI